MALCRAQSQLLRSTSSTNIHTRFFFGWFKKKDEPFYGATPDPLEDACGFARRELLSQLTGDGKYMDKAYIMSRPSSKDYPYPVPVEDFGHPMANYRAVGCTCTSEYGYYLYMLVGLGMTKRCRCGHWFKGVLADPYSFYDLPDEARKQEEELESKYAEQKKLLQQQQPKIESKKH